MKKVVANNRRAKHDYFIEEVIEAGLVLKGTEVKSLRCNNISIADSYVDLVEGNISLINSHIPEYNKAINFNHFAKQPRRLLLHRRQIKKLLGLIKTKGYTVIPLSIYFNSKNIAKVELAIARGKKKYDKREALKQEEWQREKNRLLKRSSTGF